MGGGGGGGRGRGWYFKFSVQKKRKKFENNGINIKAQDSPAGGGLLKKKGNTCKCYSKFKFSLPLFFYLSQLHGSLLCLAFGWHSVSHPREGDLANMNKIYIL